MQAYKSIRLSPTSIKVIEKLCADEDSNSIFRRNFSFVLGDYPTLAQTLDINKLHQENDWATIKSCLANFKAESSDYFVTTVKLTPVDMHIISSNALDINDINYSGTINTMLEDVNAAISYLKTPDFTKKEWAVIKQCYSTMPLHKLRISDEIILAKNSLLMSVKQLAGKNNRVHDRLVAKLNNMDGLDVLLLCCHLRGLPVAHCNSLVYGQ